MLSDNILPGNEQSEKSETTFVLDLNKELGKWLK